MIWKDGSKVGLQLSTRIISDHIIMPRQKVIINYNLYHIDRKVKEEEGGCSALKVFSRSAMV